MILSVIIVNYNAKYFLEQSLWSLSKALGYIDLKYPGQGSEIILIDNHSTDSSVAFIRNRFPDLNFLVNAENLGFSKANNQGINQAKGKYILFLNPDTIIPEDSLTQCIGSFEENPQSGAIGVRMIDGSGKFLRESKRGFPSAWAAACKILGLTSIFPHSQLFSKYYLGHLSEDENNEVDVLSGAFLMVRRNVLSEIGGFDEQFFMYAEDIDLSYRIRNAGFHNYYLASTCIIHFKGESTTKNNQYNRQFYDAMRLFVKKHFRSAASPILNPLLNFSIWITGQANRLASFFRPVGSSSAKQQIRSFVEGNSANMEEIHQALISDGRILIQEMSGANEVVFLEGKSLTYHDIIERIRRCAKKYSFKIHGEGSQSIVGSDSKDEHGEIITL